MPCQPVLPRKLNISAEFTSNISIVFHRSRAYSISQLLYILLADAHKYHPIFYIGLPECLNNERKKDDTICRLFRRRWGFYQDR